MKKYFENRTVAFYLGLVAGLLAFAVAIAYIIYRKSNNFNVVTSIVTFLFLGTAGSILTVFVKNELVPFVPTLFLALAFAAYIENRIPMFSDYFNNITLSNTGNLQVVFILLLIMFVALILSVVSCFMKQDKTEV